MDAPEFDFVPDWPEITAARRADARTAVAAAGLLGGERTPVGARVPKALLEAAKARANLTSTTELIEYALSRVALEDDFGGRLLALKGTVPRGTFPDL
jgi:hypothetical protein